MSGFVPSWPAPAAVGAYITERRGGYSQGLFRSNNLALHVGDDPAHVARNRKQLQRDAELPAAPQWLEQVHGVDVVEAQSDGHPQRADASFSRTPGVVCAVLTADCLPLLLCDRDGTQVAAVHGGWRGLAAGIVAQTLGLFTAEASDLLAYLGPAISRPCYPVGDEVRAALEESLQRAGLEKSDLNTCWSAQPDRPGHWLVDLYAIARLQLHQLGVSEIYGGHDCTYRDATRFYSYRRDGVTGRMASLIWLCPH